jgi:hypothetical protein
MYPIILAAHNILRWVVLILGAAAVVRALIGWFGKREWTDTDRKLGVFFTSSIDVQLLLGLLLYLFFSPITKEVFRDFGQMMSNPGLRFFGLEHAFYMVLAVVFAHLGSVYSKRAAETVSKFRAAAIWYGLALIVILLGMPWMRPLLPGL